MNSTRIFQVTALIVVGILALFVIKKQPKYQPPTQQNNTQQQYQTPSPQSQPDVIVDTPQPLSMVTSPLTVKGRAMNTWFFEANLPVTLKDTNGNVLAQKGFHATTDWMTPGYVEFNDTLTFATPATQYGTLIISKDNPSGLPQNDASFAVSVKFW